VGGGADGGPREGGGRARGSPAGGGVSLGAVFLALRFGGLTLNDWLAAGVPDPQGEDAPGDEQTADPRHDESEAVGRRHAERLREGRLQDALHGQEGVKPLLPGLNIPGGSAARAQQPGTQEWKGTDQTEV